MMKRITGYVLLGVGFIGIVFSNSYKGEVIPLPMLWMFVSICIVGIGMYLVMLDRTRKGEQKLNSAEALLKQIREDREI